MRVIDFHSHFFSRSFFEALASQAGCEGEADRRLAELSRRTGLELPPPEVSRHLARWIDALDAAGVEHLCTFASVPEEADAVAEAVALAKGRLSGFALVNPHTKDSAEQLATRLEGGEFRGALLFPAMHHFEVGGETDSNVFPAGWRVDRLEQQTELLERIGVSDADRAWILAGNAARLLDLPRPSGGPADAQGRALRRTSGQRTPPPSSGG